MERSVGPQTYRYRLIFQKLSFRVCRLIPNSKYLQINLESAMNSKNSSQSRICLETMIYSRHPFLTKALLQSPKQSVTSIIISIAV